MQIMQALMVSYSTLSSAELELLEALMATHLRAVRPDFILLLLAHRCQLALRAGARTPLKD